ncbi:hypothetical protein An07g02640 [Aspergillus niger]|uniref:Uncharacterized protein n=2 Tax=Aspergillus niger TaxID=5061 RepID=A2QMM4_ASPNC|nr:hypothetical protein An07g02640 [Aspergillus niger]CAK39352.1 hypothetical protein An07g02640 [Aspergillus niger]
MEREREGGGGGSEGGWRKKLSRTNFVSGVAAMGCRSNQPWLVALVAAQPSRWLHPHGLACCHHGSLKVISGGRLPAARPDSFPCGNQRRWSSGSGHLGGSWIVFPDRYYPV